MTREEIELEALLKSEFEQAVREALGALIHHDAARAQQMWGALANLEWGRDQTETISYSFREAAKLVADLHGDSHYMDWYCRGPEAVVSAEIRDALAPHGWRPLEPPT